MRLFTTIILCGLTTLLQAAPAYRKVRSFTQPNGQCIQIKAVGDEWCHNYINAVTGQKVEYDASTGYWNALDKIDDASSIATAKMMQHRSSNIAAAHSKAPSLGDVTIPVLLIETQDDAFSNLFEIYKYSSIEALYDDLFNGDNYSANGATGSIRKYFLDNSFRQFRPTFKILGKVKLSKKTADYGKDNYNTSKGVVEAINLAYNQGLMTDEMVVQWDKDEDGNVDGLMCIFAGYSESVSYIEKYIWPHTYYSNLAKIAGKSFSFYTCDGEKWGEPGDPLAINGIGVICHEFMHSLGLTDYYDINNSGKCYGMDIWSPMDQGDYNNNSRTPTAMTAFERYSLGWMALDTLPVGNDSVMVELHTISDTAANAPQSAYIYRNPQNPNEAFIFENRQRLGWDSYLTSFNYSYAHGMLITHLDYIESRWADNKVNTDPNHQLFTVVPADGVLIPYSDSYAESADLTYRYRASLLSDLWPNSVGAGVVLGEKYGFPHALTGPHTIFSPETTPSTTFFTDNKAQFVIENIKEENNLITFSVKPVGYVTPEPPAPVVDETLIQELRNLTDSAKIVCRDSITIVEIQNELQSAIDAAEAVLKAPESDEQVQNTINMLKLAIQEAYNKYKEATGIHTLEDKSQVNYKAQKIVIGGKFLILLNGKLLDPIY